jgi:hypothetical protein
MCSGQITGFSGEILASNRFTRQVGILTIIAAMAASLAGCNQYSGGSFLETSRTTTPPAGAPTPGPGPGTGTGYANLTWTAPTQNVDGSPLTNLAGYEVRYGLSQSAMRQAIDIRNPGTTTVRIEGLTTGTWYFTVAAYTNIGVHSSPSVSASKTIY